MKREAPRPLSGLGAAILAIAVTGLFFVGINIVVVKTIFEGVRRYTGSGARAELRVMFDSKNVVVRSAAKEQYEAFASSNILAQGFVGNGRFFTAFWQIRSDETVNRDWIVREDHTGSVQAFVWMPNAEIAHSWLIALVENGSNYIHQQTFGWRLSAIYYLRDYRDRCTVQGKGIREWNTDPRTLIHTHSSAHDASLPEISNESKDRDKYGSGGSIEYLVPQKVFPIFSCLCHVILFSVVGMFLARGFINSCLARRLMRSLLFLALVAVAAAHVLSYLFKLVDTVSITLIP